MRTLAQIQKGSGRMVGVSVCAARSGDHGGHLFEARGASSPDIEP